MSQMELNQLLEWFDSISNWNRWGKEDERGTINLITPQCRLEASQLIKEGITVSCARPIEFFSNSKVYRRKIW
jgi:hypothetical protein